MWLQENLITYVTQIFDSLYLHCADLEGPPDQELRILVMYTYLLSFLLNLYHVPGIGQEVDLMVSKASMWITCGLWCLQVYFLSFSLLLLQ